MCMPSHSEEQSRHSHCSVGGRDLKAISSERERPKKKWTRPVVRLRQPLPMVVVHNISEKSPHQGCKEIKAVHSTWVYNLGCLPSKRRHDQKGSSILVPDALEHTYFKPDIRCCVQLNKYILYIRVILRLVGRIRQVKLGSAAAMSICRHATCC